MCRLGSFFRVGDDPAFHTVQAFETESLAHLLQQFDALALEAKDIAFVERGNVCLPGVGLAKNAADELCQCTLGTGIRQNGQDVGESAVPALLQGLLGNDESDRALRG